MIIRTSGLEKHTPIVPGLSHQYPSNWTALHCLQTTVIPGLLWLYLGFSPSALNTIHVTANVYPPFTLPVPSSLPKSWSEGFSPSPRPPRIKIHHHVTPLFIILRHKVSASNSWHHVILNSFVYQGLLFLAFIIGGMMEVGPQ